jgi:hypothetical protein
MGETFKENVLDWPAKKPVFAAVTIYVLVIIIMWFVSVAKEGYFSTRWGQTGSIYQSLQDNPLVMRRGESFVGQADPTDLALSKGAIFDGTDYW